MARRPQISLNEEVVQAESSASFFSAGHTTPANRMRCNMELSVQTGTPSFRGSGAASHAVVQHPVKPADFRPASAPTPDLRPASAPKADLRPEMKLEAVSSCEASPPVLPSPTNAQRQPMMARSLRSVRTTIQAANWGPEVSNALAMGSIAQSARPGSAPEPAPPSRSGGYQMALDMDDLPCVPQPPMSTPTNSQRQPMMSRSNRSVRNRVMVAQAAAEPLSPTSPPPMQPMSTTSKSAMQPMTLHAGITPKSNVVPLNMHAGITPKSNVAPLNMHAGITPKPQRQITPLDTETDSDGFNLGGLVTPTNPDRRNTNMSLNLGTPSFRGSANSSGAAMPPIGALRP
ncbi:unnamed protein product [Effrenium voratum]|uniref:Uncharacterized protein n=1 Tax=Effrenium voratum TaxID=2562239 RepID=A0AA36J4Z0_9DINO|nr:unnamed protein product [Effrenium voratum]